MNCPTRRKSGTNERLVVVERFLILRWKKKEFAAESPSTYCVRFHKWAAGDWIEGALWLSPVWNSEQYTTGKGREFWTWCLSDCSDAPGYDWLCRRETIWKWFHQWAPWHWFGWENAEMATGIATTQSFQHKSPWPKWKPCFCKFFYEFVHSGGYNVKHWAVLRRQSFSSFSFSVCVYHPHSLSVRGRLL